MQLGSLVRNMFLSSFKKMQRQEERKERRKERGRWGRRKGAWKRGRKTLTWELDSFNFPPCVTMGSRRICSTNDQIWSPNRYAWCEMEWSKTQEGSSSTGYASVTVFYFFIFSGSTQPLCSQLYGAYWPGQIFFLWLMVRHGAALPSMKSAWAKYSGYYIPAITH